MIIGPDGNIVIKNSQGFPTGGVDKKQPIVDIRTVMFAKMMLHPQTKEMVMIPMQDIQYRREGSDEWFSMPVEEVEKHEFNPEDTYIHEDKENM